MIIIRTIIILSDTFELKKLEGGLKTVHISAAADGIFQRE